MSSLGQLEAPWRPVASAIAEIAQQITPTVAGKAAEVGATKFGARVATMGIAQASAAKLGAKVLTTAGGAPFVTSLVVTSALQILLAHSRSSEGGPLQYIKADTEALIRTPHIAGIHYLELAEITGSAEKRQQYIQQAIDKLIDARATLQARGHPADLFGKALVEYQLGNCQTLLGYYEEASDSYRRSHTSATQYLLADGTSVRAAWDQYLEHKNFMTVTTAKYVGTTSVATTALLVLSPVALPLTLVMGGGTAGMLALNERARRRARDKFVGEVAPVLDFTATLQQLQTAAPTLALKFEQRTLTLEALEERLSGS